MNALIELTTEECLSLLTTRAAGRIALRTPGGLRIFPVNYALFGDAVVFRTLPYGEIANNAHEAEIAFQVDELDHDQRRGWSVMANGTARRVDDPGEVHLIREEWDPEPWASGQRNLYFKLEWVSLTGRQVGMDGRPSLIVQRPASP